MFTIEASAVLFFTVPEGIFRYRLGWYTYTCFWLKKNNHLKQAGKERLASAMLSNANMGEAVESGFSGQKSGFR